MQQIANVGRIPHLLLETVKEMAQHGDFEPKFVVETVVKKLDWPVGVQSRDLRRVILTGWADLVRGGLVGQGDRNGNWHQAFFFGFFPRIRGSL